MRVLRGRPSRENDSNLDAHDWVVDLFTVGIWKRIHNATTRMRRLWFAISSTALGSFFRPDTHRVARNGIHLAFAGPKALS